MTALLGSIAAISLIVGGIGIMNIMLVSVTERTKEIGLRLAVGARRRDVLLQFLVEALVMSLLGGVLGVGIGIVTARGLTAVLDWPTELSALTLVSAFAIAAAVGIGFGYYPARRASRLDPDRFAEVRVASAAWKAAAICHERNLDLERLAAGDERDLHHHVVSRDGPTGRDPALAALVDRQRQTLHAARFGRITVIATFDATDAGKSSRTASLNQMRMLAVAIQHHFVMQLALHQDQTAVMRRMIAVRRGDARMLRIGRLGCRRPQPAQRASLSRRQHHATQGTRRTLEPIELVNSLLENRSSAS